jgi:4-amino-4-deoxy-L-arabinose transferase-like glycosyltransferase
MLFRLIRSNRIASYFLIPLLGAGAWSLQLYAPTGFSFYEGENRMVLFGPLYDLISGMPQLSAVIGLLLNILAAILVQRISVEYNFFKTRSLLPGITFMLITGGIRELHHFHPVYPAIIFLLVAIYRLFSAFDQRKPYSQTFDAALLLGLGSLFYLNLIVLLPAFIAGGSILARESRWREIAVSFLGFIVPWIFVFFWYFLIDQIPDLTGLLKANILTDNDRLMGNIQVLIFPGFLLVLIIAGSFKIINQFDEKKVSIRQYFLLLFLMFVSSVLSVFLLPASSTEALIVSAIPATLLIANLLLSLNRRFWGELIIYLLVGFNVAQLFF